MEEKFEKIEISSEICQGCLNQDRKTCPLGELEIFYDIMLGNTMAFDRGGTTLRMCWECTAKLNGFKHFRDQMYQAQNVLMNMFKEVDPNLPTLSKLITIIKNNYDYEYNENDIVNITDNNIVTDIKPNEKTVEFEPVVKLEKATNLDISQNDDNNDSYSDTEELPESLDDTIVKEEIVVNITDNNIVMDNKPNEKTVELEPVVKLGKPTDLDISQNDDNNDSYSDKEELPKSLDDNTVKEEIVVNITDNNIVTDNKPNEKTVELEPVVKLGKPTDLDISQNDDNNDSYSDKEELPKSLDDNTVKEETVNAEKDNDKKLKTKKKSNTGKKIYGLKEFCVIEPFNTGKNKVDNFFNHVCLDEKEIEEIIHKKERELKANWKFKCRICNLGFFVRSDLQRHDNLYHHNAFEPNTCILCKVSLPTFEALRLHWKQHHSHFYMCKFCNEYIRKTNKAKHLKVIHKRRIYCKICNLDFPTMHDFSIHYTKEHDIYICDYCNKECPKKETLIRHISRYHRSINCSFCSKKIRNYKALLYHKMAHHPEKSKKKVDKEAAYCVECDKQFVTYGAYTTHLKVSPVHGAVKPVVSVPCPQCDKVFKYLIHMKNHLHQVHMQEKAKFYCEICNKYYSSKNSVQRHHLYVHLKTPKKKDKICNLCGKAFHARRTLVNHVHTHTGERPYQCSYCPAAFTQKSARNTHQKSQHKGVTL